MICLHHVTVVYEARHTQVLLSHLMGPNPSIHWSYITVSGVSLSYSSVASKVFPDFVLQLAAAE